jgi:XTP/dITP diphosphohydrolase
MKICFATNNPNKVKEINTTVGSLIEIVSLADIGCTVEIPEEQDTIEGNSSQKANYVKEHFNIDCFADDTGLEVEILGGEPGVYSARYAGEEGDSIKNMTLLLKNLEGKTNRKAQFKTVVTLILDGIEHQFEGIVKGAIRTELSGNRGFGYDPIFEPEGYDITFAEMSMEQKNKISHRGKAVKKLLDFLKSQNL